MDAFTDQLTAQAAETGVILASITPAAPTLVSNAAPAAPTTAASAADGSGPIDSAESVAGAADASAESVDAAASGAPAAPSTAAGPAGQIYSIAVTVVGTGTMAANRALLSKIEKQGPRRALVTSASFAPVVGQEIAPVDGSGAAPAGTAESGAAVTTPPPPPTVEQIWTMTVQLQVFVAPQSPDEKAAMASEIKSNG
jgi:hypothetical protein